MDQMRMELQGRSQELIGTRAQLDSMESQVAQLSAQMNHWNGQLARLESTLRENDQQRNDLVNQLTQSVARLADQHESATSELVLDAIER
jgi:predicted  nucleic acid-binding Zn-ribbon protein